MNSASTPLGSVPKGPVGTVRGSVGAPGQTSPAAIGRGDGTTAGGRPAESGPRIVARAQVGGGVGAFAPLFLADWTGAVFLHYEVDADVLQKEVPFQLDLWEGRAFVSLVAFTLERLRPRTGGRLAGLAFRPIAHTRFLNVRTYVRQGRWPGIYFIAEFLSNWLCVPLGPPTFGLPYRRGDLDYSNDDLDDGAAGRIRTPDGRRGLAYRVRRRDAGGPRAAALGTLDWFLVERYAAFTCRRGRRRMFRVEHPRWPLEPVEVWVRDEGLLETAGGWWPRARLVDGHYSAGVREIGLGPPCRIDRRVRRKRVFFDI